ncbi:hypothetical protein MOV66_04500 [Agrobacterium sp. SHOUNA12C]|nr:hypothetical protein [Agrobacterium sp. BETTINA12B]MCJ9755892.1 hypothetical protein [Agrobacterium sp. SHOUNA12C]
MAKVTVYLVKLYDISTDGTHVSDRYYTEEGAKLADVEIIPESEAEIEADDLVWGEQYTEKGYRPRLS